MDLRSIINTENGEGARSKQNAPTPVTPIQTGPPLGQGQQIYRNYSHSSQVSPGPGKHGSQSQEYGSQNGGPYASPTTYQSTHLNRPPPPTPIQAPPPNDLRSPTDSYSAPSPYRHTPTSSISIAGSGQYPFPQSLQNPQSPAQRHQYPPPTFHQPQRESYPQSNPPPHLQQQYNSQIQPSPVPQTPPIGIPGANNPYFQHHRSQSSLSNSTPTSAHSQQQQYQNQFTQDSPIHTIQLPQNQFPIQHQRQQSQHSQHSQPGTPLGPPLQTQRQSSGAFTQPTSPYQQRAVPTNPFNGTQFNQISPAPANASIPPRMPTTPQSAYDSQRTSTSSTQQRSLIERERSLSVSPKTRLPSQTRGNSMVQQQPEEFNNSTKRKMEDREMSFEAPQRIEQYEVKPQMNGDHRSSSTAAPSPQQPPPRKKIRYTEPPIWARSAKGVKGLGRKNMNGRQHTPQPSAQSLPATLIKQESNGMRQASPAVPRPVTGNDYDWDGPLGPWEPSISGTKPPAEITRLVADFLYMHVVNREDTGELASHGVEIEIEAKLGQLVSKETNVRLSLPVRSETVLLDNQFVAFKSTMTEAQHRGLNEFLNKKVQECMPSNNGQSKRRVKIDYLHRRETDKFYELPSSMHSTLPPALRALLNPRYSVKVRVTHDQKTGEPLAKIIKARVADLDLYFPSQALDCRISINFEMKFDGNVEELIASSDGAQRPDRNKDRLSYRQSHYQVDLTQVTQNLVSNGVSRTEKEHELEIELSAAAVTDQALKARHGEPNDYFKLVDGFIDNVRLLARTAIPV